MTARIVSYNLLVPKFAEEPGYYYKCQPEFLKTEYRWNFIQSQLEQEICRHDNTIVCLQELSRTLLPKLDSFFRRMHYKFFHKLYGHPYNDYMGVGMAIPVSMELKSNDFIQIRDYLRSNTQLREKRLSLLSWPCDLWRLMMDKFSAQPANDPWEIAMSRNNTLIFLHVIIDGKHLCIGTYHMPCLYNIPDVMIIHSYAVKDLMFQLADGHNLIVAGDFNFKPYEIPYRMIAENGYANRDQLPKSSNYEVSWRPNMKQILKSAYREKNGTEPTYTNFSDTLNARNFRATLDYIFFSGNLVVDDVLELPDHPTGESYPDETHPSDHLMLAASFRLL